MKHVNRCILCILLGSCSAINKQYEFNTGYYNYRENAKSFGRVYVNVTNDSVSIIDKEKKLIYPPENGSSYYLKRTFDMDILINPFKYRPSVSGAPRMLNASFNGNLYLGYRLDRFHVHYKDTPFGLARQKDHWALSLGAFGGLGSVFISPWTTNYQTTDEYDGLVLSRGIALLGGVNRLTVGLTMGWDYLTDRDQDIWIYQNKPWYAIAFSLHLN